ncbi:MAG: thrombospondin type 3 repeat-containing protein, partial [Anaerolineae bacterium]|nr:thrombospondin type 3 repeat-containing protein [Anaerolineae bacterium]
VDACPGQGSIGYGVYPNGCPIQDGDGDGVSDPNDACPSQGGIGFGIYPNGCPILDGDGDGVPDNVDACPGQGSIGFGVNASGCPIQPPPPSDRDGDGVPDNTDRCPDQGNEGNGIDSFGCPNQPPPPPANDGDGDGILDNEDRCPTEPGPRANGGCPIIPPTCYISFLANLVNLRSGPSTVYNSVTTKNYTNEPVRVVGLVTNPNNPSETWYELEGGVFAIANPNWVRLGQPCDFSQPTTNDIPIEITDSDADGIPDVIDVCTETGDAGYGVKNDGCPKTMQDILTNVRESHPRDVMRLLGCEIVTGELLDTAPLFVLMTIVEAPSPCDAKAEYNRQQQTTPSVELAQTYFITSPERQHFFEQLLTCDLYISNHLIEIIANSGEDFTLIDTFIAGIIDDEDICKQLFEWRNTPDIVPIPPDLSPNDSINWGILICIPHQLLNTRYQQLVSNLLEIWELDITEITCDDINSANRIGNPSQDHLNLFRKLLECRNE